MKIAYPLKDSVEIDGIKYNLGMSFDNVLRLFDLLEDDLISEPKKINTALLLLTGSEFKDYTLEQRNELLFTLFIETVGNPKKEAEKSVDIAGNPMPDDNEEVDNNFSIKQDGAYIYASFMSDYGMDLIEQQGKLSWYKFKALLGGLSEDTKFMKVIDIRTRKLPTGKGTQKEREQLIKMKKQYELKEV